AGTDHTLLTRTARGGLLFRADSESTRRRGRLNPPNLAPSDPMISARRIPRQRVAWRVLPDAHVRQSRQRLPILARRCQRARTAGTAPQIIKPAASAHTTIASAPSRWLSSSIPAAENPQSVSPHAGPRV